jgi:hypothetical protein
MARIDLGDEDSPDTLADALRQLEQQQSDQPEPVPSDDEAGAKRRFEQEQEAGRQESRDQVQDAVTAIRQQQVSAEPTPTSREAPRRVRWVFILVAIAVLIAAAVIALRPTPLPGPALSARDAVRGFWSSLVEEHYEAATVFYPALVDKYASRKQAALFLQQFAGKDAPVRIGRIGEAEPLPDSDNVRVSWEVTRRSGRPWTGEFIVGNYGDREAGYVILYGP